MASPEEEGFGTGSAGHIHDDSQAVCSIGRGIEGAGQPLQTWGFREVPLLAL